jgi:phage-related protein
VQRPDAILELLDDVLLVAAALGLGNDLALSQLAIIGHVEEVAKIGADAELAALSLDELAQDDDPIRALRPARPMLELGGVPLVWLGGEIKTPPLTTEARVEAGFLLRKLQAGETLSLPHSRPMPVIGPRCHELRIQDRSRIWRIIYRIDRDAVVILEVFAKTSQTTPKKAIDVSQQRLRRHDEASKGKT